MPTLILQRHAKAVRDHEAPSDQARGLTARGRSDAAAAAREMIALGLRPSAALASSAARTRQTFESADWSGLAARFEDALYLAPPETIWRLAQPLLAPEETVLVIGHNPGMQELIAALIGQAHDHSRAARQIADNTPTAAFAAFSVEPGPLDAAAPRLLAAWSPKD